MRKYYKFGEMLMILREEYKKCNPILDELNRCVRVDDNAREQYFRGILPFDEGEEREIRLFVEKRIDFLDKLDSYLLYGNSDFRKESYAADLKVIKNDNGSYGFRYAHDFSPLTRSRYNPIVEITDQEKFAYLVDCLLAVDLMQLRDAYLKNNYDVISMNANYGCIHTFEDSAISLEREKVDELKYSMVRPRNSAYIDQLLELEMPADKIPSAWLNLFEKYEGIFDKEMTFSIDNKIRARKGIMKISDDIRDNGRYKFVKMLKK